ncbi:hypothetical protein [Melittangium boletus]|uniref:Uncharacterized protein n=1 Tax=Melittangium boletus DSM 14713 TaxID=1294270 RepID=A0A250IRA0_9BACT|nr:hypothetical protein [Melittangium boletus]ATB33808.1 hypothetical protein MEBOL_007306 [Melittangium boletus DSM 14713]
MSAPPGVVLASLGLALACGWYTALILVDYRHLLGAGVGVCVYRPGLGPTTASELVSRWRWAWLGWLGSAGLLVTAPWLGRAMAGGVALASCGAILGWILVDRRLHHARYTSMCMAVLALALMGYPSSARFTGMFASFFASQLYLVAGIRKVRSAQFMSGRVIVEGLAFGAYQAAAGNREFFRLVRLPLLADLLSTPSVLFAGRLAAILTAGVELALGLGAMGLLPVPLTLALALPTHLAFLLISPRRIVPFTAAALGLLTLAMTHPLLRC